MLWFDVGNETYTTIGGRPKTKTKLWFDVGSEAYTTIYAKE